MSLFLLLFLFCFSGRGEAATAALTKEDVVLTGLEEAAVALELEEASGSSGGREEGSIGLVDVAASVAAAAAAAGSSNRFILLRVFMIISSVSPRCRVLSFDFRVSRSGKTCFSMQYLFNLKMTMYSAAMG